MPQTALQSTYIKGVAFDDLIDSPLLDVVVLHLLEREAIIFFEVCEDAVRLRQRLILVPYVL